MKATFRRKPLMEELLPQDKFVIRDVVILSEEEFKHFHPLVGYDFIRQRKHLMLVDEHNTMANDNYWVDEGKHPLTNPRFELAGYIYKITNKRLMKSYVGKTIKPPVFRWWQHLAVDDKFEQHDLSDLVFEVLEVVYFNDKNDWDLISYGTKEEKLNQKERYYIDYYDAIENGYNKV